ncbi:MAG: rubrerythrin family protein [Elusimicrobiota bacterium]|jgi:rubrerythrin|nr:rubrerythrin family protein [Elusimicrobiota bacterium]
MGKSLKGTKTEKNLLTAFAGESQARNRYTFFASKAKKEGFEQIAAFFTETANNEKEHAERFFKFLEGGELKIEGSFPAGKIGSTLENLKASAAGEHHEWSVDYPNFADIAKQEGFDDISVVFKNIAIAEKHHEERYIELADNVANEEVFTKDAPTKWVCRNCGYVYEGKQALDTCPACAHSKAYMELLAENY